MKNSFFILGFLISLLISCPPPTPVPGPDEGGSGSGNETAKEFTVSFDANGGTGTIAPMKVKAGTEITLPDGTAFSRKYYTFNYWTISGLDFYEEDSKYTVKADTVFSAEWRHNQVEITYDSNDDTVSDTEPWWVNAGSDLILPGNPFGSSSPAGKYFHGWTTSDTATDEADILAPGSSFRVEETDLTFYAFWGTESVTEYKVNFSGTEMKPIAFNRYTEEIRLPLYTGEDGMICKGWDTSEAAATVVYYDGGTIPKTDLTGNIILYPILEKDTRVALTYIKNGAKTYPAYSEYTFHETADRGETMTIADMFYYKDDGTDTPWMLSGIRVTETDNPSVTLAVTPGYEEPSGSCWQYTAGDKPLTVEFLWEKQPISDYHFEIMWAHASGNQLDVPCLTDIALSPNMIAVTDENGNPANFSRIYTTCVQIQDGIRTHACVIEFPSTMPVGGTYKVIFTVSGQTIHTETVTVSEPQP